MKSPIKWAGGKSKIIELIQEKIKKIKFERYVDLFSGSLAIPLELEFKNCVLNDINSVLINLYITIKNNLKSLLTQLEKLDNDKYNNKNEFNILRDEFNILKFKENLEDKDKVRLASLFIYLNKRSFNGLYRENKSGIYNVPYRKNKSSIYDKKLLIDVSKYFNENEIKFESKTFEKFNMSSFKKTDLVYLDPPYYPSDKSKFTSYSKDGFTIKQQEKLAVLCHRLNNRGIKFIMSNSPCKEIEELYKDFKMEKFYIGRQMRSADGKSNVFDKKNEYNEILIYNF